LKQARLRSEVVVYGFHPLDFSQWDLACFSVDGRSEVEHASVGFEPVGVSSGVCY